MTSPNPSQVKMIDPEEFRNNLITFMEEAFATSHRSIFLDKGTSLFETLETVSAQEASIPVGGKCASLAAQVAHIIFYIDSWDRYTQGDESPRDWSYIWRTVEKVTPAEWEDYKRKLKETYQRMDKLFRENKTWDDDAIGGAFSIVVHTAYHLGEIRQALCTLK